jgi:dipeptidyl aminopeptidase/acylaminoacyl peptidase
VIRVSRARFSSLSLFLAVFSAFGSLPAADEGQPTNRSPWKPEDLVYAESSGGFRISPDSRWVAWVKGEADREKDKMISNLFLSSLTEDREIPLTRGSNDIFDLSWSPDSESIAFISDKPRALPKPDSDANQIWLISIRGGEAYPLTELAHGPRGVQWLNGDTLMFAAPEAPSAYEQALKKKKDDSQVVDDAGHEPPVRLFKINIKDKKITRLTENMDWIENWSVSKDGKYAVAIHQKSLHYTFDQKVPPVSILHNLTDGSEKQIFTEGRIRPYGFEWLPDSSGFYAWAPYSTNPRFLTASILLLYYYDLSAGKSFPVPLDWENGIGSDLAATEDGFIIGLAAGHRFETAHYARQRTGDSWTWKRIPLGGEHWKDIQNFEVSADEKTIVYRSSTAGTMPQLFRARIQDNQLEGTFRLTGLNASLEKSRTFSKSEVIHWKGAKAEEVEGILRYPENYQPGKRYPLITAIHGGPADADLDAWSDSWGYPYQLLTQRGAFILSPNYHGSGNYGLPWVESICCGNYYDLETSDINSGVDQSDRARSRRSRQNRHHGLVQRLHSFDQLNHDLSLPLQSSQRRCRRRGMDQRLGQRNVRGLLRLLLFRQNADGRSAAVHPQVPLLQARQGSSCSDHFPGFRRYQRASLAELVLFPCPAVLRPSARQVRGVSRRTSWPS